MSNLLFSYLVLTFIISTVQAIACYNHYDRCTPTAFCLNDTLKKNCTGAGEVFCFKDAYILSLATRGCATIEYCNATAFLGDRYCCNTDYCNHAMRGINIPWFMMIIMLITIVIIIK